MPSPSISVSATGSGPLALVTVRPVQRENSSPVQTMVQALDTGVHVLSATGARLGRSHFLSLPNNGLLAFQAAAKSESGLWSEWSKVVDAAISNYTAGSGEVSIGSGKSDDLQIRDVSLEFPDLSQGSGIVQTRRTLISKGPYQNESRTDQYRQKRASFHVVLKDLDLYQTQLLHHFFKALHGPTNPFVFQWTDPIGGLTTQGPSVRYVVRFRDPQIITNLFDIDRSETQFFLTESRGDQEGGDC